MACVSLRLEMLGSSWRPELHRRVWGTRPQLSDQLGLLGWAFCTQIAKTSSVEEIQSKLRRPSGLSGPGTTQTQVSDTSSSLFLASFWFLVV